MKKISLYFLMISFSIFTINCKNWVTNVDPPVDEINDSQLNTEGQLTFLANGVLTQFAKAVGQTNVLAAGLSDAFYYESEVPRATNSDYKNIDGGYIVLYNGATTGAYGIVSQLRYYADDLIRRTNSISVSETSIKNNALFTGYFYGGYARYLYATYFGLNPTQGGSPINDGPFINSSDMFELAITRFKESLKFTNDQLKIKTVNSVIARAYLYKGDYADAAIYADKGLINGDNPFQALYNTTVGNWNVWWRNAGAENANFVIAPRFKNYIVDDIKEENRIKIDSVLGYDSTYYYYEAVYPLAESPQNIITWQENNLMKAELIIRGFGSGSALDLVNEVRSSHNIAPLSSVDLNVIYTERDKELFASGNRLVDERRFNEWHLASGSWEYLPIPQSERDGNPNIN